METIIEKLRKEIGRRKAELKKDKCINNDARVCRLSELKYFDRFLGLLELQEEKEAPKELEEAAIDFADTARKQLFTKDYAISSIADYDHGCIDGFIAGAEWQAGQLLQGAPMPEDTVLFNKGVEEGKRLMMKEALEARIYGYDDGSFELVASWLDMPKNSIYKDGQKVKLIIVKED